MELRLSLLESFLARGSDGKSYKVRAFDRLVLVPGTADDWESTGVAEYRLEDNRLVATAKDGTLHISGSDVVLTPAEDRVPSSAR